MEYKEESFIKRYNFNKDWRFCKESGIPETVSLPHDAMRVEQRDPSCPGGANSGYFPGGEYEYRKTFQAPEEWRDCEIILEFEGVYHNSRVFLNGQCIGGHPYGYTNYFVSLTAYLRIGEENELLVTADNSEQPNSRWYTGSGIYRPVWLYLGRNSYIPPQGVRITSEAGGI